MTTSITHALEKKTSCCVFGHDAVAQPAFFWRMLHVGEASADLWPSAHVSDDAKNSRVCVHTHAAKFKVIDSAAAPCTRHIACTNLYDPQFTDPGQFVFFRDHSLTFSFSLEVEWPQVPPYLFRTHSPRRSANFSFVSFALFLPKDCRLEGA